jgi:hypothetical protein
MNILNTTVECINYELYINISLLVELFYRFPKSQSPNPFEHSGEMSLLEISYFEPCQLTFDMNGNEFPD